MHNVSFCMSDMLLNVRYALACRDSDYSCDGTRSSRRQAKAYRTFGLSQQNGRQPRPVLPTSIHQKLLQPEESH